MTIDKLQKANDLLEKIDALENILDALSPKDEEGNEVDEILIARIYSDNRPWYALSADLADELCAVVAKRIDDLKAEFAAL